MYYFIYCFKNNKIISSGQKVFNHKKCIQTTKSALSSANEKNGFMSVGFF